MARQASSIFTRDLTLAAVKDAFPKLDPRLQVRNPVMFIVELGSVITTGIFLLNLARGDTGDLWFVGVIAVLALADRAVRQLRRGDRRRARQGPGGRSPGDAHDDLGIPSHHERRVRGGRRRRAPARRRRRGRGRSGHPGRRRDRRRRGLGRRVGDHRRVRPRDPRSRRRPLGGHGRHAAPLRPARDRGHAGAGPVVPRPHDRPRRGRRAAQDAQRDRAQHPARRAHDHLPRSRRHAQPVRDLCGHGHLANRPHRAARLADPDDDRRPAVGDRHRRHGPARAAERARHVRARGRGVGRRRRAPPRQDRHDHAREPAGRRVPPRRRRRGARARRGGAARLARRRDSRRAAPSSFSPRSASTSASASSASTSSCPSRRRRG